MSDNARTNGFRIRTLNQDCDRLAVQSCLSATWFCSFRSRLRILAKNHIVGIAQNELVVLRPYQGKPVKLILPDGAAVKGTVAGVDASGALRVQTVQGEQRGLVGDLSLRPLAAAR